MRALASAKLISRASIPCWARKRTCSRRAEPTFSTSDEPIDERGCRGAGEVRRRAEAGAFERVALARGRERTAVEVGLGHVEQVHHLGPEAHPRRRAPGELKLVSTRERERIHDVALDRRGREQLVRRGVGAGEDRGRGDRAGGGASCR